MNDLLCSGQEKHSRMQGEKGGEESETCQQMRKAGYERAQAEGYQKKGIVEKLQQSTSQIKDFAADKMDKMGVAIKGTVASSSDK